MKKFLLYILIFFSAVIANAQQLYFSPATSIPLRDMSGNLQQNAWAGGINSPIWSAIDLNGDGLKDLYMYDKSNNRVCTFLNDGSAGIHAYHYAPEYVSRFPKVIADGWGMCYDYNCDGKEDFFALDSLRNGIEVWRNDFTIPTGLQFTKVSEELLEDWSGPAPINIYATSINIPTFSDVDNDGDLDIITSNNPSDGKFAYHKNLSMDLYNTCDSLHFVFDDKCWGNFALSVGSNTVNSFHDAPCGTPAPIASNTGGNETVEREKDLTTICALDIDGDGAKELLIGDETYPNTLMVHNGGTPQNAEMDSSDSAFPSYDSPVNVFEFVHNAYIDVDNDGKRDLLASAGQFEDRQGVWYYKNTNTDAAPIFSLQKNDFLQNEMLETGEGACPVFFDYDGDGLMDIVVAHGVYSSSVGSIVSRLSLYKNIGTSTSPSFQLIDEDYATLSNYNIPFPIAATFGDLDGDGDQDMLIGDFAGYVHYFNNSGGAGNAASFLLTVPQYMGIDVGNNATPQLVDLDNDGLLDLVIGMHPGTFNYYHNNGSPANASISSTPTLDTLGEIQLAEGGFYNGYSVPYVFTFNGTHQMLTANMNGDIYYYDNIDNNLNGTFTRIDTVASGELGIRSVGLNLWVSGGDINNDGLMDMLVGLYSGGVQIYYGSNTHIGIVENENAKWFACYPNPTDKQLTVQIRDHISNIEFYNVLGEKMDVKQSKEISNQDVRIDVSEFPDGIYIIAASNGKSVQHSKVIIHH